MLLYGYGSYEISIDPTFSASRVSACSTAGSCSRSRTFAAAASWGVTGTRTASSLHKTNTFTDFVACAEHLVAEGWTSPDRLAARGGSAGGLLMGAVANLRPDLFHAVVAEVPFVDVPHHDARRDPPAHDHRVGGVGRPGPRPRRVYALMKSYSPYDNVDREGLSRHARDGRAERSPGAVLGAGEVGGEAAGHQDRPAGSSCSRRRWAPGTRDRRAATTPGGTRRSCSRSSSTSSARPDGGSRTTKWPGPSARPPRGFSFENGQTGRTFWASSPLRPGPMSNSTRWPSSSVL